MKPGSISFTSLCCCSLPAQLDALTYREEKARVFTMKGLSPSDR